jgi:hypothetical protein
MIQCDEETHTYKVDGIPYKSVTTLIASWFPKFDAKHALRGMKASPSWESSKYFGMTDDEIICKWESDGKLAAQLGTDLHYYIEQYLKQNPLEGDSVEIQQFKQFASETHLVVHELEWRLFDSTTKITGAIDCACINKDGTLDLYDWKRCGNMLKTHGFATLPELVHIPSSNYWKYTIQLNMYKYLVEKTTSYKVKNMFIVCFHPSNLGYQKYRVTDMYIENVLKRFE